MYHQHRSSGFMRHLVLCALFTAAILALAARNAGTASSVSTPAVPLMPGYSGSPTQSPAVAAAPGSSGVLGGAADTVGGYAGQVLERALAKWQPPAGQSGIARVLVRIGSDGRVLSCEATPTTQAGQAAKPAAQGPPRSEAVPGSSFTVTSLAGESAGAGYQVSPLVDAACRAVGQAGQFDQPPYAMVTEVYLSLAAGHAAYSDPGRPQEYAQWVIQRVQPHVLPPVRLKGSHTTRVHLRVRPDGGIEQIRVDTPSGNQAVDAAVLQAFTVPGVIPAPGEVKDLVLTFTVNGE